VRATVVLTLLVLFALARPVVARWRRGLRDEARPVPRLPARLLGSTERTWLVFTTPYCASCGPVADTLRTRDPRARVVTVDATREPELAQAFLVRSAPTALLADADGAVRARLVGAAAVDDYVRSPQ
jgi:hypothetical protein